MDRFTEFFKKAKALEENSKQEAESIYTEFIDTVEKQKIGQPLGEELKGCLASAYNNRGYLRYMSVDFDRASDDYSSCLQLDPQFTVAYYNRGMIHYRLARFDEAIQDLGKSLQLDPSFEQAKIGLEKSKEDRKIHLEREKHGYYNS